MNTPQHPKPDSGQPTAAVQELEISFYKSADKIYARQARGIFANLRVLAMLALLGIYYLTPWLSWDGNPLVFFDLPHRRFHVLGLTLVPQDFYLLTAMLALMAFTLFFFTTLGGRVFCGYACPQTVWTEAFMWMERLVEGDGHARMKLDRSRWTTQKILRKGAKHLMWMVFALFTGLTFVAYFVPARELFPAAFHAELVGWPLFWTLFYALATWGNAGFMREQVCKYMCPYARFQSAMFDKDTLMIAYDEQRGEPRRSVARREHKTAGDCIDCSICVQVCPTGIDIRNGLQYECIACAACIDACDEVMDSIHKPRGLIRYTSERHDQGEKFKFLRPRAIGYGVIWLLVASLFVGLVLTRSPVNFDVVRDRKQLYREMADGGIENVYAIKISNKDPVTHVYHVTAAFVDGGAPVQLTPDRMEVGPGAHESMTATARTLEARPGVSRIRFEIAAQDDARQHEDHVATFMAPAGH